MILDVSLRPRYTHQSIPFPARKVSGSDHRFLFESDPTRVPNRPTFPCDRMK